MATVRQVAEGTTHPGQSIGKRLKVLRDERRLSLRALASQIDVSPSLLSQIETGRVNPSLDTLFALADALDISVPFFFGLEAPFEPAGPRTRGPVVKRRDRSLLTLESGVTWHNLMPYAEHDLEFMEIRHPPGTTSSPGLHTHGGRHLGVVLKGELTIRVGFSEYRLTPGDSIAFDATRPHQLRNDGDTDAIAHWLAINRHEPD